MAAVQTDLWPSGKQWSDIPALASKQLRDRYNRMIKTTPNKVSNSSTVQERVRKEALENSGFVSPRIYNKEESIIQNGGYYKDKNKKFKIGDIVLTPITKQRRAEIKDKEYMMHYNLMPSIIVNIFHGQRPAIYSVKNPLTGKTYKRRYYGIELKKIQLPKHVNVKDIINYKINKGKVEYILKGGKPLLII